MIATNPNVSAVHSWTATLDNVEQSLGAAIADVNDSEQFLSRLDASARPAMAKIRRCQKRIDDRMHSLAEHMAVAEQCATEVGGELASAETDLRRWSERLASLQTAIGEFLGRQSDS